VFSPDILASHVLLEWRSRVFLESPTIETDRLILRMATRKDVPAILHYYLENQLFLEAFEPSRSEGFYTYEFWQEQVEKALFEFSYEQSLKLCLFPKQDVTCIVGKINFHQMQRGVSHSCTVGYSLAERDQGKGYMTEALKAAIAYLFADQNYHRIAANYMPRNQRSANVLRRLGFMVEGYARDYLLIHGQWEDHILTSLTNAKWKS
jgi:ribosomal-protein-alanine N-acetyltransferase